MNISDELRFLGLVLPLFYWLYFVLVPATPLTGPAPAKVSIATHFVSWVILIFDILLFPAVITIPTTELLGIAGLLFLLNVIYFYRLSRVRGALWKVSRSFSIVILILTELYLLILSIMEYFPGVNAKDSLKGFIVYLVAYDWLFVTRPPANLASGEYKKLAL